MRRPEYISPSALALFEKDPKSYYLQYLANERPPRFPQTQPMSVGSAFDAFTKSDMHWKIFGNHGKDGQFEFDTLFCAQVESQNRDWARVAGKKCYEVYKSTGALVDLLTEIAKGIGEPRFEIDIRSTIGTSRDFAGVPILGKPDCLFRNSEGANVILDWKVNGYCGRAITSPLKGYMKLRPDGKSHKDCFLGMHKGMMINRMFKLEDLKEDWAAQLAAYGWSMGEPVGTEFISWIDQLACGDFGNQIKVATHRMIIGSAFQLRTLERYVQLWKYIQSGYIFRDMSQADNDALCKTLDQGVVFDKALAGSKEEFFNSVVRQQREW